MSGRTSFGSCTAVYSYVARHPVPAGLTAWAAVSGLRGDTSIEGRAYFDDL